MNITLEQALKTPGMLANLKDKKVLIWSGQWKAYWRANARGYTDNITIAGEYDFEDAWEHVRASGPEKKIILLEIVGYKNGPVHADMVGIRKGKS